MNSPAVQAFEYASTAPGFDHRRTVAFRWSTLCPVASASPTTECCGEPTVIRPASESLAPAHASRWRRALGTLIVVRARLGVAITAFLLVSACTTDDTEMSAVGSSPSPHTLPPGATSQSPDESLMSDPDPIDPCFADGEGSDTCIVVDPFQPDPALTARLDRVFDIGEPDFVFEGYGNEQESIVVDGVPYSRYWQLDDPSKYVLHPMAVGRYVFNNAEEPSIAETTDTLFGQLGAELPDGGGVAFFYPNQYPLSRMSGPDYMYSAISQSEILAGFMRIDRIRRSADSSSRLASVRDALFYPYEMGGVNLSDVAQLELPLFRANPEIILNGWLHSLMHLNDYAIEYDDPEVAEYVARNLRFFARNNEAWFDESNSVSRYSDTSPHRIVITPEDAERTPELSVLFNSSVPELSDYLVPLEFDLDGNLGGYDSRVAAINADNGALTATVTCSTLFETILLSTEPITVDLQAGTFDPERATPGPGGTPITLQSEWDEIAGMHRVSIEGADLICGYPTNFAKANSKNFYHVHHVVALLLLAEYGEGLNRELRAELIRTASAWYRAMGDYVPRSIEHFEDPQKVLDGINRGKLLVHETDAVALLERAGVEVFAEHR